MDILLKPSSLCLAGSMNHLIISAATDISFVLKYADTDAVIVQHTYTPNKQGRIEVDLETIVSPLLSFELKDVSTAYRQTSILRTFTAVITPIPVQGNSETATFSVLRAGIDRFADSAANFLKSNFLTWQPTVKPVTYYTPEFLTYYAVEDAVVRCRAYVDINGQYEETLLTLANLAKESVWTIPVQYAIIAGKLGKLPSYYDVWVETASGNRLTYIQRYYATDIRSEEEQWVLFENSLGGIDTFRAYGDSENTAKHTHNIVEIEDDFQEYRVDTEREFKKNTGFLNSNERKWLLDFFPSLGKYLYIDSYIRRIVVTDSDATYKSRDLPSSFSFTYKYADARPYLNIPRTDTPPEVLSIKIPDVGSFTVAPRLIELDRLPLSDGALFPVQSPFSETWSVTTAAAILDFIAYQITAAYKGDGAFGHTHDNMSVLSAINHMGQYLTFYAEKIKAGYADLAEVTNKLAEASADWQKIVRTDKDSVVRARVNFEKAISFGQSVKDSSGAAIYQDEQGNWHFEGDIFHARKKLTAEEVELMKSSHIRGKVINSPGSFTISKVERITGGWRCYFTQTDADGRRVSNTMGMDDLAYVETFNLIDSDGVTSNHYWHRRVFGLGTDYVDIADNTNPDDYASGSDTPKVGDEVSTLGNKTNPDRQHAIIQAATGPGSPYYRMYVGIDSFSLPKPKIQMSPTEGSWWMVTDETGRSIPLEQYVAGLKSQVKAIQEQSDKQIVLWFGDAVPTLDAAPSSEWLDNATRDAHLHDVYYNRSYAKTGGGRAYSFEKTEEGYRWIEITDADVLKSLEAANRAQDTADGKRRVFIVQPTVTQDYDEGDLWVNASYKNELIEYSNDVLRCVTPKKTGEPFAIGHWKPVQKYTTKTLTTIEQRGDRIMTLVAGNQQTMDAMIADIEAGRSASLLTMQGRFNAVVSSLTGTTDLLHTAVWDDYGNLMGFKNVGILRSVAGEDGSMTLFCDRYDAEGHKTHSASLKLTAGKDGSSLLFDADNINFLGKTVINDKFTVDAKGNVTMDGFKATNANITGSITASEGKVGPFTIGDNGLYVGDYAKWWTDEKADYAYMNASSFLLGQQIGYFNPGDVASLKVGLGKGADPDSHGNEDTFCDTAVYVYRRMNNLRSLYKPAVKIVSDNVANRNVAMELRGGLRVWGGIMEKGKFMDFTKQGATNVLDLSMGTTFILYNGSDADVQCFIPTLTEIRQQLGITGGGDSFCVPFRIMIAKDSPRGIFISSQSKAKQPVPVAEGGIIVQNDGEEWDGSLKKVEKGDILAFSLCYTPTAGYYCQLNNVLL